LAGDRITGTLSEKTVGAYYGGYAALAGAAFTPDLYACAASISGIADLPALLREEVPGYGKSIRAPILIIYGTGDGGVPSVQSERDVVVVVLSSASRGS